MSTRALRRGLLAALGFVAGLAGFGAAEAAEPGPDTLPISVIAIQTPDADDQAEALTKALRAGMKDLEGWSMAEGDYSLEVLSISLKCVEPPDAACQSRIADQIKADRFVWGIIKKKGANVVGDVHLWTRGQGTTKTTVEYSANLTEPNDEALRRIARSTLDELTGGPPKGTVHVKAGKDVAGQVFIDGKPVGALVAGEGKFPFPAGQHKVVVKAPGYSSVESPIAIKPQATAEVVVTLVPLEEESKTNWRKIGGFVGIGAGVAFAAGGIVGGVKVLSIQKKFDPYRKAPPEGIHSMYAVQGDLCTYAAGKPDPANDPSHDSNITNYCNDASTFQILQFIMYPLAAVSAGAGVYLLMTSGEKGAEPKTGWTVAPMVGSEGGKLNLTYR
ncbi:MAG TPA: carboxypeptidase-like regulatory domain-containing protein, partial [Polyangiaceae bacterium]|nr:carboxypeptidase-like regulatory domain-containing protein [Polyangiaceae bacterium]